GRIEQVLANLVVNAVKHSKPSAAIDIIVARGCMDEATECAVVTVRDRGTGIPADLIPRIFERYFTLERARSIGAPRSGGVGLGLYICDQIVRKHGGRMWAESELGRGTSISFMLPLAR